MSDQFSDDLTLIKNMFSEALAASDKYIISHEKGI